MTLLPGTRLGPYEITAAIGAGGMGEVFRARDTKLNRDVAIKVLPAAFADDPERLARFTREAQTLASLNHPNIAAIYGIEEIASSASSDDLVAMTKGVGTGASRALVMELVEGEDLSAHIARGPMPIVEALRAPIPAERLAQAKIAADALGDAVFDKFPFVAGMRPAVSDRAELVLNRTWRPALSVTGLAGAPAPGAPPPYAAARCQPRGDLWTWQRTGRSRPMEQIAGIWRANSAV